MVRVAVIAYLGIPLTSKGTVMYEITESPLWSNMFDSFMNVICYWGLVCKIVQSIDWKANKYVFGIYLGFDKADPIYDTGIILVFVFRARMS